MQITAKNYTRCHNEHCSFDFLAFSSLSSIQIVKIGFPRILFNFGNWFCIIQYESNSALSNIHINTLWRLNIGNKKISLFSCGSWLFYITQKNFSHFNFSFRFHWYFWNGLINIGILNNICYGLELQGNSINYLNWIRQFIHIVWILKR